MSKNGFTLIEMSIVLVIIGLVIGGILVGQDLVKAAGLRSLMTQKQKYDTAVNTFYSKYGALPGNIPPSQASSYGLFTITGGYAGLAPGAPGNGTGNVCGFGSGNGIIAGSGIISGLGYAISEGSVFWRHLSDAGLIDTSFPTSGSNALDPNSGTNTNMIPTSCEASAGTCSQALYNPAAKIGSSFFAVSNTSVSTFNSSHNNTSGYNTYYLEAQVLNAASGPYDASTLTVNDAYNIDAKIDDGQPNTGKVMMDPSRNAGSYTTIKWAATATSGKCTVGGGSSTSVTAQYNLTYGNLIACFPMFLFN